MRLTELVDVSRRVGETRGRKAKVELLATFLRALAPDEAGIGVAYLTGELPQGRIGIGYATLRELGAGMPAPSEPSLTLREVDARFDELSRISGAGSAATRREVLGALAARATDAERDLLVRLIGGELRQGALEGVMLEAIAHATSLPADQVRRAAMLAGSVREVGEAALREGAAGLARFSLVLFRPVLPMLASPADDVESVLERLGEATFELKLDGARVQVHRDGDDVRVYSRSLHDVTDRVPEIVSLARAIPARSFVLDGEAIAMRADGAPEPFQVSMRRFGRKNTKSIEASREALPLSAFFFDCLLRDGASLMELPEQERRRILETLVPETARMQSLRTANVEDAERFFAEAIARGHEGLMAKALDAPYDAGSRGSSWLKLKAASTLDLVVLAVERGSGRRQGWLSNIHLGARDPDTGGFVMLGKTFKGMTDEMLTWQTARFTELATHDDGWVVHVRPELVVEIAINGVQESTQYPGGVALRFARVKRYRPDKRASEADTLATVRALLPASR